MAFRSPLVAATERADAAEAEVRRLTDELAAQSARIARVDEVEAELASARARLRTEKPESSFLKTSGLWLAVVFSVGAGLAYAYQETRITAERAVSAATELGHARERQAATAEAEAERSELTASLSMCEEQRRAEVDEHDALRRYFDELSASRTRTGTTLGAAPSLEVGAVDRVSGAAPVGVGTSCWMTFGAEPGCSGEIRCGGRVVHRLGCAGGSSTEMHHRGLGMEISNARAGWTVWIEQSLRSR